MKVYILLEFSYDYYEYEKYFGCYISEEECFNAAKSFIRDDDCKIIFEKDFLNNKSSFNEHEDLAEKEERHFMIIEEYLSYE